jgi:lipoate synthase
MTGPEVHPLHDPSLKPVDAPRERLAPWLRKRLPPQDTVDQVKGLMQDLGLNTVCQSARCPNLNECWSRKAATFMIMGDLCTRTCRFCTVPKGAPLALDAAEPEHVAEAAFRLGLHTSWSRRWTATTSRTRARGTSRPPSRPSVAACPRP